MECKDIVQQNVCVSANIITTPEAEIGDIEACCVGEPVTEKCFKEKKECVCILRQLLCVRFPIKFSVRAEAKSVGIVCDKPEFSSCPPPDQCNSCNEPGPCDPCNEPGPCGPCHQPWPWGLCHQPGSCGACHKPWPCDLGHQPGPYDPCNEPGPCHLCHKLGPCGPCHQPWSWGRCHKPWPCGLGHQPGSCGSCHKRHCFDPVVFKPRRQPLLFTLAEIIRKGMFFSRW